MPRRLVTALAAALLVSPAWAENWPQWRGPRGDSTSLEQDLPLSWGEGRGLAWKVPLPEWGDSTPAIWGDALFLTTQHDDKLLAMRLDKRDGRVEWTRQVGTSDTRREAEKRSVQKFHKLHNNASPSPVTDGEVVIFHFGNGDLAAYDLAGQQLWQRNLQEDYGTYTIWWGHANSPVLVGDLVISVCMQDSLSGVAAALAPSYLVAHDKRTGREVWKSMRMTGAEAEQGDSYTTPLLHASGGRRELIVMGGNQLDAYDPATGRQLWYLPGLVGGRTITGPTLADGLVYATRGQKGELVAVRLGGTGQLAARAEAWRYGENTPDTCCPVVWGGLLFTISDAGIAQCFDAHTGHLKWKQRLSGGNYKASPLAAEGRIYFLSVTGLCTVVSASDRFEKLVENQLDDETIASPAASGGCLFVRGKQHLYCIGRSRTPAP